MKNRKLRRFWGSVVLLFVAAGADNLRAQETFANEARALMTELNTQIIGHQNHDKQHPDHGGVWCPGCGLYHTRAAEALFPLAYEHALIGEDGRLRQAIDLGNWLIRQQKDGGEWLETPEEWTGTTTDQLLMMLLAYPILEPHLSEVEKRSWLESMEKAGDYLASVMDNLFASINYCATTTATLAELNMLIPKTVYEDKARELAAMIVDKMNFDDMIEGEGSREGRYKYGIDIGYNMEMSLWGIARYAAVTGDKRVRDAVSRSLAKSLWFIYPDGTLDGSSGIRSNKWTVFGSGTSDGCHPLMAMYNHENPAYATAAIRNIGQIRESITKWGLLGMGPHYDEIFDTPPCIYPTFTKAKSMAMAMLWMTGDGLGLEPLPTDSHGGRFFPAMNTGVVRTPSFCGTVTAYNYKAKEGAKSKYMHRPAGGTMSALWAEGFGMIQASSQTEYHRWEPMSFPEFPDIVPLTPRIEMWDGENYYTNLYEYDATISYKEAENRYRYEIFGRLKDRDQRPTGAAYSIEYDFGAECLSKTYMIDRQTVTEPVYIIEPLLIYPDYEISQVSEKCVTISRNGRTLSITMETDGAVMKLDWEQAGRYYNIYPSLKAVPVVIRTTPDNGKGRTSIKLTYSTD